MLVKWLINTLAFSIMTVLVVSCQTAPVKTQQIEIAVHYPSVGRWYPLGKQTLLTSKMALDKFKNQLEKANIDIRIKAYEYDFTDHKKQSELSKKMADNDDLMAVISYMDYDFSKYKIPLLTWNQRSKILEKKANTIFRLSLSDTIRQKIATWYLSSTLSAKNIIIVLDGEPFSLTYQHSLRDRLKEGRLNVIDTLIAKYNDSESIKKAVKIIQSQKPDAIIHVGSGLQKAMNAINLNLKKHSLQIPTLCLVDYPPESIPKGLRYQFISLFDTRSGAKKDMNELIQKFSSRYKEDLGGIGIYAYEASQLIFTAILSLHKKSKNINRVTLAEELSQTRFTGITGLTTYNEIGDRMTGQFVIGERTPGKYKLLKKGRWPLPEVTDEE